MNPELRGAGWAAGCSLSDIRRVRDEFVRIVRAHGVDRIVDVPTVPKSRHNPQSTEEELRRSLPADGIDYRRLAFLGGLRHNRSSTASIAAPRSRRSLARPVRKGVEPFSRWREAGTGSAAVTAVPARRASQSLK